MFDATIELFDAYYRRADVLGLPTFNRDLGCEVRERLEQLKYIVDRVRAIENQDRLRDARVHEAAKAHIADVTRRGVSIESEPQPEATKFTAEEGKAHLAAQFEIKLFTESFYYLAGRIHTILKHKSTPLPGLKGFDGKGVRNVRNKLLEHTEQKGSHISIQSFASGGPNGPVIKAVRYQGQEDVFPTAACIAMRRNSFKS